MACGSFMIGITSVGLNISDFMLYDGYMKMTVPAVIILQIVNRFWHRAYRHKITEIDLVLNWKRVNNDYVSRHLEITNRLG